MTKPVPQSLWNRTKRDLSYQELMRPSLLLKEKKQKTKGRAHNVRFGNMSSLVVLHMVLEFLVQTYNSQSLKEYIFRNSQRSNLLITVETIPSFLE